MSTIYSYTEDELVQLLGNFTTITLNNTHATQIQGYLYTVDPDSHQVVVFDNERVHVVMSHAIKTMTIDKEDSGMDLRTLDDILKYTQENQYTQEWINKRKQELIQHFEVHRIPIEYGGENEPVIHVLGSARVESPYVATSVVCDNALIRKRVRDIILQLSR